MSAFVKISRRYVVGQLGWYLGGLVSLALTTWIALTIPELSKQLLNSLDHVDGEISRLNRLAYSMIGLGVLQMLVRALSRLIIFWPGRMIEEEVKNDYFRHFMSVPVEFFTNGRMIGDLISRLAYDVGQIRVFYAFGILQILNLLFLLSFALFRMFSVDTHLTMFSLAPLLLMMLVTKLASPMLHRYSLLQQSSLGQLTNRVTEAFANILTIQTNSAGKIFSSLVGTEIDQVLRNNLKIQFVRILVFPLATLMTGCSYLVILFYGGREVISGRLSVGDILAFNIYVAMLSFPLAALGIIISIYHRAKAASERLIELDEVETESGYSLSRVKSTSNDGVVSRGEDRRPSLGDGKKPTLVVRDLSFAYPDQEVHRKPVLKNLNFELYPGERLGLFGAIGSGKSTLLNLISRLLEPNEGSIFYRERDILEYSHSFLRKEIGYVLQQPFLFAGSIEANLKFGLGDKVDFSLLQNAARSAQVETEIESFANGWQTHIGEGGVRLSGGQKRRLALARALLRDSPILLLDDTTSALDSRTEVELLNELAQLGRTIIVVSHRENTLKMCDRLLFLENGAIAGQGNYDELKLHFGEYFEGLTES